MNKVLAIEIVRTENVSYRIGRNPVFAAEALTLYSGPTPARIDYATPLARGVRHAVELQRVGRAHEGKVGRPQCSQGAMSNLKPASTGALMAYRRVICRHSRSHFSRSCASLATPASDRFIDCRGREPRCCDAATGTMMIFFPCQ